MSRLTEILCFLWNYSFIRVRMRRNYKNWLSQDIIVPILSIQQQVTPEIIVQEAERKPAFQILRKHSFDRSEMNIINLGSYWKKNLSIKEMGD